MRTPMTTHLLMAIAIMGLCIFAVAGQNAGASNNHAADEAAIRDNVRQLETGWNTKQGALFAQPFVEDADYVVINGRHISGRATLEKEHQRIFDTVYRNTTLQLSVKHIRFLRSDVAVVHVNGHRNGPKAEPELESDAFMTMVMTKVKNRWQIVAFQNTKIVNTK